MSEPLSLIVEIAEYNNRGPLFHAALEGSLQEPILTGTTQPLLDACRYLLAKGIPAETEITMRHIGSDTESLKTTVGCAAKLTVQETKGSSPRFTSWVPFNRAGIVGAGPDIPASKEIQAAG